MIFAYKLDGTRSMLRTLGFTALAVALTLSLAGPQPLALAAERQAPAAQPTASRLYLSTVIRYDNPSYISPFGVTMFNEISDRTGLSAMANAGAEWAMINARWVDIEPTEGAPYDFSSVDVRVQALNSKGMRALILFDHNPTWALAPYPALNRDPIRWPVATNKLPALAALMRAMATRYNGSNGFPRVDYYALYGEPDNWNAWGMNGVYGQQFPQFPNGNCAPLPTCTMNNPALYADALAVASPAIKEGNSNARVMIGATAYVDARGFNVNFTRDVLARLATKPGGITAYLDAVGFNNFPITTNVWPTIREKTASMRLVTAQAGVPNIPIIVLELGVWSGKNGTSGDPPYPVNETQQAQYIAMELVRGLSVGLKQIHVFQPLDVPNYFNWGLFRGTENANDPKPAYFSYVVVAHELDRAVYTGAISGGGLEGYTFLKEGGTVTVFWGASSTVTRDFGARCVRTVTRTNQPAQVTDNGAGDGNPAAGTIRISAAANEPVFVSTCAP